MMPRKHIRKWQQQRKQEIARRERIKRLQAQLAVAHSELGRLDPQECHVQCRSLRARIRTLEQQLRYISLA